MDLQKIKPAVRGKSDKYSWRLYQFFKTNPHAKVYEGPNVLNGLMTPGELYVGTPGEEGWFYGQRLIRITCGDKDKYAFPPGFAKKFRLVPDFFELYEKSGRCLWDPDHKVWMAYEEGRYEMLTPDLRRCRWCGEVHTRKVTLRTVEDVSWEKKEFAG